MLDMIVLALVVAAEPPEETAQPKVVHDEFTGLSVAQVVVGIECTGAGTAHVLSFAKGNTFPNYDVRFWVTPGGTLGRAERVFMLRDKHRSNTVASIERGDGDEVASWAMAEADVQAIARATQFRFRVGLYECRVDSERIAAIAALGSLTLPPRPKDMPDDVAAPPLPVRIGGDQSFEPATLPRSAGAPEVVPRQLEDSDILGELRRNREAIQACRTKQAFADPTLEGTLTINFLIEGSGRTKGWQVEPARFKSTVVGKCVVEAVKKWNFPRFSGQPMPVDFPVRVGGT